MCGHQKLEEKYRCHVVSLIGVCCYCCCCSVHDLNCWLSSCCNFCICMHCCWLLLLVADLGTHLLGERNSITWCFSKQSLGKIEQVWALQPPYIILCSFSWWFIIPTFFINIMHRVRHICYWNYSIATNQGFVSTTCFLEGC